MPVKFWDDPENKKYHKAYFSKYENIWHHGDFIERTSNNGFIMRGRSDATLNPGGVRIGTSEIYSAIKDLSYVEDSLIIHLDNADKNSLILFVKSNMLIKEDELRATIRQKCSPRHVPDLIYQTPDIPYTISGKKVEVPVKKILSGLDHKDSVSKDSLKNPGSIDWFLEFYKNQL